MRPFPYFNSFRLLSSTTLIPLDESYKPPVLRVVRLTFALPAGSTLGLDTGGAEHVKLWIPSAGKPRSYSVTSDNSVVGSFDLTIKVYPGGAASGALGALAVGDSVRMCGPVPPRAFRYRRLRGRLVYVLLQGLGITEGLPVVRAELEMGFAEKVTLVHGNRYEKDVLFGEEVAELGDKHDALEVVRLFSGEDVEGGLRGRIDGGFLKEMVGLIDSSVQCDVRFLVVGSKAFIKSVWKELGGLGFRSAKHSLLEKGAWEREKVISS